MTNWDWAEVQCSSMILRIAAVFFFYSNANHSLCSFHYRFSLGVRYHEILLFNESTVHDIRVYRKKETPHDEVDNEDLQMRKHTNTPTQHSEIERLTEDLQHMDSPVVRFEFEYLPDAFFVAHLECCDCV